MTPAELMARLDALARRSHTSEAETTLAVADLVLDRLCRKVTRGAKTLNLKPREFKRLEYLMRHAHQVVTRTMLLETSGIITLTRRPTWSTCTSAACASRSTAARSGLC